jgi:hypothetical protein
MNPETTNGRPVWHVGLGFLIASLLFAGLVLWVKQSAPVPAIDADQAALRVKDLTEIRKTEAQALNHPGWIDQSRGIVRLPISLALKITALEWRNPTEAHSNLVAREEQATKPLPKPAAAANPFE